MNDRVERELRRLDIDPSEMKTNDEGKITMSPSMKTRGSVNYAEQAYAAQLVSDPGEPKKFCEAMDGTDSNLWNPSAKSEIMNFLSLDAWEKFPRDQLNGHKLIGTKWVFKVKNEHDGTVHHKSRVNLLGYMQVPGVDYTESFSPVATDTTVRAAIATMLYCEDEGWTIEMIDIEAAFLNADLESDEPVYVEWPEGIVELGFITEKEEQKYCIKLNKAMYGGVDVPRLFMKTLKTHLVDKMAMLQSGVDPCLFYWRVAAIRSLWRWYMSTMLR
jgi:hypothetical protein